MAMGEIQAVLRIPGSLLCYFLDTSDLLDPISIPLELERNLSVLSVDREGKEGE